MTERSDDARETLAPVTYLPGVQASSERPSPAAAPARPAPVPARLTFGDEADPEVAAAVDSERAHNVSLHALTRRGMSRREIERTLRSRDLDDETIAVEVERLEASGLIDDMALAQNLVGTLQERKGYGRQAIAAELTRRLLSPAAIEYALELIDTSDELARAHEVAGKRASQLRSYDHDTAVRRLTGYMMRRGYSGSTLRAAVEHALPSTPASRVTFR
jgi:regulatory protein